MLEQLAYLHGAPTARGILKAQAADFVVNEDLGFEPCGEGEHIFVRVRKTGENTAWVAGLLADAAGVNRNAVTWAGLKDRHAVTEQWFGIHLPGKAEPDLSVIESDSIQILQVKRHNKKLRVGYLKGNHFILRLTGLEQADGLESRLQAIAEQGCPTITASSVSAGAATTWRRPRRCSPASGSRIATSAPSISPLPAACCSMPSSVPASSRDWPISCWLATV